MNCPNCQVEIPIESINVSTDLAHCQKCNEVFKISETFFGNSFDSFQIDNPPKGVWIDKKFDRIIIGASLRSPIAFFLVPFMLVWSGGSIGGIYGTQIYTGHFNLFLSLFGIPFLIGAIIFWSITLMAIWGKVEITLTEEGGTIFTGLGSKGLRKNFTWDEISAISEQKTNFQFPGSPGSAIFLEGKKRIVFGRGLKSEKQYYLFKAFSEILTKVKKGKNIF